MGGGTMGDDGCQQGRRAGSISITPQRRIAEAELLHKRLIYESGRRRIVEGDDPAKGF